MSETSTTSTEARERHGLVTTIALGAVADHMRDHHLAARDITLPHATHDDPAVGVTVYSDQVGGWLTSGFTVDDTDARPTKVHGYVMYRLTGRLPDGTRVRLLYVVPSVQVLQVVPA